MRRSGVRLGALVVVLLLLLVAVFAGTARAATAQPTKVLVVVMDQMHPEYAQQYNMTNVLWLEKHGAYFPNAYVGDMASETVVSHNVMVSGLLPKHMGWSDEALRDTNNVLGGGANGVYVTGDLGYSDFAKLIAAGDYPKLGTYLHAKYPGSIVACVGEKNYQVRSMTAGSADFGVFLGSATNADPALTALLGGKYRPAAGAPNNAALPAYIANDTRFDVNSDATYNDYGTNDTAPAWIYPEDGDRMIPGSITGHLGGDNWVADATIKIMQNENWSGLFVNFGAIDKVGHMWGGGEVDNLKKYQWDPNSIYNMVHEPFIAKNADTQLGRLIGELKATGQYDNTLIVVVADHGSTAATKQFNGTNAQGAGDYNWYHGDSINDGNYYNDPLHPVAPALKPLTDLTNVSFTYASTAIEAWLTDFSMAQKQAAAAVMRSRPGVIATYVKSDDGNSYVRTSVNSSKLSKSGRDWFRSHAQELVNTMAWSGSADVVGLLQDNTSYGAYGDHGGAQKDVQSIPMVFYNPGLKTVKYKAATRLVDLMPTIMRTMGIAPTANMDGKAYFLKTK
ncbi:MAG TPA: alkaline phosphatase family protein [Thermoleophilia bacterium]|nr:alkaline phosphatase family protein [Thermoleophilia bacterium]